MWSKDYLHWLDIKILHVLTISTVPSGFLTSQVHPEPKFPTVCFTNSYLKFWIDPN